MSRSSQRNALLIHRYYSQFGATQLKEMVKNRLKRARFGPKCPFWWPWRSLEGPVDQIWSLLPLAAPFVLESWLPHTFDWYWASSGPPRTLRGTVLAQNAAFWPNGGLGQPEWSASKPNNPKTWQDMWSRLFCCLLKWINFWSRAIYMAGQILTFSETFSQIL